MGVNYYKLNRSFGKFRALKTNGVVKDSYCAEISDNGMDQYNNGRFNANVYTNGALTDIEINDWTFSFHIEGRYHKPGTYESLSFKILAVDPEGDEVSFYSLPDDQLFSEINVLCSFLDLMHTYSNFQNAAIASKYCELLRALKKNLSKEVGLEHALFFKDFYMNNIDDNPDKYFMRQIKEAVNQSVDLFLEGTESYKIM